ncbi:preprotein translocase subunit SecG [Planctobacterium marinum]|uniref:preprotein translocase subunit SecG n=1 Tax=Planctobacterium marinum TaxID=1631968 RepID=UPI001E2BC37F|nr:preprotein translocase subunit SecG [Planctobacterium marinum]MCC2607370.1 preprotein translocase subunit SecG [Planctobacterium marinum]
MLYEVLLVIDLIVAIMLIGLILIQQGKGADMGASFGGGGSNTVFGSTGSGNFLTRTTAVLATIFFIVSLALGNMSNNQGGTEDTWENLEVPAVEQTETQPASGDVPAAEKQESDNDVPNT